MVKKKQSEQTVMEKLSNLITAWVGTPASILAHTCFFIFMFILPFFGVPFDKVMLILTTVVSLEAIYLAIFIQMTVNKTTQSLESVEENIDEIQEDVEDIQEDVDEMQEDVEDLQEDVDEVHDHVEKTDHQMLQALMKEMRALRKEISDVKSKK